MFSTLINVLKISTTLNIFKNVFNDIKCFKIFNDIKYFQRHLIFNVFTNVFNDVKCF